MPTISAYTEGVVVPQYNTTDYSTDLELQLLLKKQSEYNSVVSRLGNLRNTSLNINMLNVRGQQRLDQYNQDLNEMLSQDLGDLTDPKAQAKVASFFSKVSQDSDLKQRSRLSQHYQGQIDLINRMKESKDQTKSGYNKINELVFRKWSGGLEDFALADDISGWEGKMETYTPFKDIDQKMVNITKLLHAESTTTQKPALQKVKIGDKEVEVPTGYNILESSTGVSSERIRGLLQSTLDADELAQFDVLSKYRIIESGNNPEGYANLYQSYNSWLQREHRTTKQQLEQVQALKKQFDPSRVDPSLPQEERIVRQAAYQAEMDRLSEQEVYLQDALTHQLTNNFSQEEWMKKRPEEILPFIRQLTIESYVNGISDSLEWKSTVERVGMDETYFANLKIKGMQDRLALDAELGRAGLKLRELKLQHDISKEKEKDKEGWRPGADIIKSPTEVFTSWDKFTEINKQYLDKTTPIITSKGKQGYDIDPKKLLDRRWLDSNAENHEVKLWNIYSSKFRDEGAFLDENRTKPNLAGFEAFKKMVENGDYKNDPNISAIWSQYQDDSEVSQHLIKTGVEVASVVNKVSNIEDVRLPGGQYSLGDYARKHGWNGQGEMKFGIPDGKGGFKEMTWSEVRKEYERTQKSIPLTSEGSNPQGPFFGQPKLNSSIIQNDPEFFQLVTKAFKQEQGSTEQIKQVFLDRMPQWLQGKQETTEVKSEIYDQIPMINSTAMKYADETEPLGLSTEDIVQISRPVGIGVHGYFMLNKEGAKKLNDQKRKLRTLEGNIDETVTGNTWYQYDTPPVNPLDYIYNSMFEQEGAVKKTIKGYEVSIRDIKNSPTITLVIKGSERTVNIPVERKDPKLIFRVAEEYINQLENQSAKPK